VNPPQDRIWMALSIALALALAMSLVVSLQEPGTAVEPAATADTSQDAGAAAEAAGAATLSLTEFAMTPEVVAVAEGGTVTVTNDGTIDHNVWVDGHDDVKTVDLPAGESAILDVSGLPAGAYTIYCQVAGHEAAGMTASLEIGGDGAGAGATAQETTAGDHASMSGSASPAALQAEMVENMKSSIGAFPAQTQGEGAAVLEPTVLDDGTKLFELTVDETQWEVEPGKFVDAVAYNGIVPGPTMFVDPGDKVTIRVINELDHEGTSLHPHGLKDHRFEIDGVTFISQDPIEPGDTMDYSFVTDEESVVTYHSHHMSLHQVPNGLFGAMIIGDYAELAGIEGVVDEQVLITNDAGNIGFTLNGKSFPATKPYRYTSGDRVVIHYANEGQMAHPMHLHNQTGTVIAKDGYLLPEGARYQGDTFNVSPGERLTVVYEMNQPGTWVFHCHILSHVKRSDGTMFGMLTAVIVDEAEPAT
jgi:manganese oxidase